MILYSLTSVLNDKAVKLHRGPSLCHVPEKKSHCNTQRVFLGQLLFPPYGEVWIFLDHT